MTSSSALQRALMMENYPTNTTSGGGNYTSETLAFTGGLITDAVRAAGVEGDGLTPPAGVGVWPAATNIVTQSVPGATPTTGVTVAGDVAATLTLVTDATAPFQNANTVVWLFDNSAGVSDATVDFAGNATAAAHTGSIWAKAITGTATVSIEGGGTPTSITGTASYARYSQSRTASAGDNLRITAPAGAIVRFTAGQLETGSIATPFIYTNGGTASRLAGRVQQPVSGLLTATQGWVAVRFAPGFPSGTSVTQNVASWGDDTPNRILMYFNSATSIQTLRGAGSSVTVAASPSLDVGMIGVFAWDAATVKVSVGGNFTSAANATIPTITNANIDIASQTWQAANRELRGRVLWCATGSGTLTDADAAALNAFGDTPPTWAQIKGALPAAAQLTSLWPAVTNAYQKVVS